MTYVTHVAASDSGTRSRSE